MIPGVKGRKSSKVEAAAFHESDANCNTCKHLRRVASDKLGDGLMRGRCGHHPYGARFVMVFAPDDWMGMRCWEAR